MIRFALIFFALNRRFLVRPATHGNVCVGGGSGGGGGGGGSGGGGGDGGASKRKILERWW